MLSAIDYKNSLLAVPASLLEYYGAGASHETLPLLDELLQKSYKNVVVMLFDGMGTEILERHLLQNAFLRRHMGQSLSSVFPPTTTAATVTMETGLAPIEHGWLGWILFFKELGNNINIFPNTVSGSDGTPAADFHVAQRFLAYENIFQKIDKATQGRVRVEYISPFAPYQIKNLTELCGTVESLCGQAGEKFLYTYWHQPDYDMHDLGIGDEKIKDDVLQINDMLERLCADLQDTLIVITADHGLTDVRWRYLADYPLLLDCLSGRPSMESRAMSFFIKEGSKELFVEEFQKHFGDCYMLLSREQVLSQKIFGPGTPHAKACDFIGDFLAVAVDAVAIEASPRRGEEMFRAAHAGMTDAEMRVPFIAVECK